MSNRHVTPLVLAGGRSSRFGDRNKLLAQHGGRSLLHHVVRAVKRTTAGRPIVVMQNPSQRAVLERALARPADVRFAVDDPAFGGPVAGIFGGVDRIETPWVFVFAGDMPLLRPEAIRYLCGERSERQADAIVPVTDGTIEPLHALYRRQAVEDVRVDTGPEAGARDLVGSLEDVVPVPVPEAPPALERSLTNVNTQQQLMMLEATDADAETEVSIDD
jgi:molybdopterin-guanine dinucleotide biosynthesis protein A